MEKITFYEKDVLFKINKLKLKYKITTDILN